MMWQVGGRDMGAGNLSEGGGWGQDPQSISTDTDHSQPPPQPGLSFDTLKEKGLTLIAPFQRAIKSKLI